MISATSYQSVSKLDHAAPSCHSEFSAASDSWTTGSQMSRFESIGAFARLLSPQRARVLGILVKASEECGGCDALRPIWRAEIIHRAERLAELTSLLECDADHRALTQLDSDMECRLATYLAACYRALTIQHDLEMRPCATLLRDIGINLNRLFSPIANPGNNPLNCSIERIALPAFKQRALVLLASTLIMDVLVSTEHGNGAASMELALWTLEPGLFQFTITDYRGALMPPSHSPLVNDLADLLEAETAFHSSRVRPLSRLDIVFPSRP